MSLWEGTGALVKRCARNQEQMVCRDLYAQPQPRSSTPSCTTGEL